MRKIWTWNPENTPPELHGLLRELGCEYPVREQIGEPTLHWRQVPGDTPMNEVVLSGDGRVDIAYTGIGAAARGLGRALAGLAGRETSSFTMLGIMLDLSRNQVFKAETFPKIFRHLAMSGYNTVLLYCEDTYELPGEPYFGYMRGAYSAAEIRAIDEAAARCGIEVIGCIQTLGHLEQIIRWRSEYEKIADTARVLLSEDPATYALIAKMLDFWSENLHSRRIHIGMDETHDLGRGRYLDRNGYRRGFDIFNGHLRRVSEQCRVRGLQPMIWGDMYFRLSNPGQIYYDLEHPVPADVRAAIPGGVDLVYWDYYHCDREFYEQFIDRHRELGSEPLMGSGIWIWARFWYDHELTRSVVMPCVDACREKNVRKIFFTMWGDDGCYCPWFSSEPGLCYAADAAYGVADEKLTAERFATVTGKDYFHQTIPAPIHRQIGGERGKMHNCVNALMWDDLLLGIGWRNLALIAPELPATQVKFYRSIYERLAPFRDEDGLAFAAALLDLLVVKLETRTVLGQAYGSDDRAALQNFLDERLPALLAAHDRFVEEFRRQWLAVAKPFGLEAMQIRFGGLRCRYQEAGRRVAEYLAGTIAEIPELAPEHCPERIPAELSWYHTTASGTGLL